jgi:hypothetical protein
MHQLASARGITQSILSPFFVRRQVDGNRHHSCMEILHVFNFMSKVNSLQPVLSGNQKISSLVMHNEELQTAPTRLSFYASLQCRESSKDICILSLLGWELVGMMQSDLLKSAMVAESGSWQVH